MTTGKSKNICTQALNEARHEYNRLRQELGHLNLIISIPGELAKCFFGTKADYKRQRSEVFASMNRARNKLLTQMKHVHEQLETRRA